MKRLLTLSRWLVIPSIVLLLPGGLIALFLVWLGRHRPAHTPGEQG
jgi:hypothetical protein